MVQVGSACRQNLSLPHRGACGLGGRGSAKIPHQCPRWVALSIPLLLVSCDLVTRIVRYGTETRSSRVRLAHLV